MSEPADTPAPAAAAPLEAAGAIDGARLVEEARHRARLLEMVSEISRAALEAGGLQRLLEGVVAYVHRHFPPISAAILLVDAERGMFQETAHAGTLRLNVALGSWWPLERGIVGRSVRAAEPQLVLDVAADPDYVGVHDEIAAEFAIPIVFHGRILGVLNLESREAEVFTPENVTVFRTFADQLAGAIHLAALNRALEEANEQLREANRRLERLSLTDALTELSNRRHFDEVLEREWRRARRAGSPVSAVMVDLDCFKLFNDTYGHGAGDDCLRRVAATLKGAARRPGDLVARLGGEEFVVLLPGTDADGAEEFAERLRARVEALGIPHAASTAAPVVTCCAGAATVFPGPGGCEAPRQMMDEADRALYRAKREGRNRVHAWAAEPPAPPSEPEPAP